MPLDPVAADYLELVARANLPTPDGSPESIRELQVRRLALVPDSRPEVARVDDRSIPGPAGDIPIRVYTPVGRPPFPIIVYFHGGGWVIGSLETHDGLARHLAVAAQGVVVSVEYRPAPEHPFPAAVHDAYAATAWVARNGAEVGGDGGRLAVAGDSAGGNLAAVVSLIARDRGEPDIGFQLLMCPITDCDFETVSYRDNASGYQLTRATMQWAWDRYIPSVDDRLNPYASPLRAASLADLPPAYVITTEFDPLKSEGQAYAHRLRDAGVPTVLRDYPGLLHAFVSLPGVYPQAVAAIRDAATTLREALAS
jgi:acetyl esterase